MKLSDDDLLSPGRTRLSSARARFTVLFEMGRSGSTPLWSSDLTEDRGQRTEDRTRWRLWLCCRLAVEFGRSKVGEIVHLIFEGRAQERRAAWFDCPFVFCPLSSNGTRSVPL